MTQVDNRDEEAPHLKRTIGIGQLMLYALGLHARLRHLRPHRPSGGAGRQCGVAVVLGRARRGTHDGAVVCFARFAASARGRRGICHAARLPHSASEFHGRAGAGLLGPFSVATQSQGLRRQRQRVHGRRRRFRSNRIALGFILDSRGHRLSRHSGIDVGQCRLHDHRGVRPADRHRRRHVVLGQRRPPGNSA